MPGAKPKFRNGFFGKILPGLLMTAMLLSGCGAASEEEIPEEEMQEEEMQEEETVVIGVLLDPAKYISLNDAADAFNLVSEKYRVVLQQYDETRFLTELIAGNGPDLFSPDNFGLRDLAYQGVLADLTPFLETSQALSADMLEETVLEAYTVGGILICIPPSFTVNTLFGRVSELGEEPGWTGEEFLSYVDSHYGATITEGTMVGDSPLIMMMTLWQGNPDAWVDYETRTSHFDGEEFRQYLEYAAGYQSLYDNGSGSTEDRWMNGEVLLLQRDMGTMMEYLYYQGITEGDTVAIGFPTAEGVPCHWLAGVDGLSLNVNSENKEGAWAFLEYLILHEADAWYSGQTFPTLKTGFAAAMETAMERTDVLKMNGYDIPQATQEDVDNLLEIIDSCKVYEGHSEIEEILIEELSACFYDGRSVEDTVRVIQNRAQLYLNE